MVHAIEKIGAFAGLVSFFGLAVFALLSFAHGRDIRRLREWAGSAPERDADRKQAASATAAQRAEELRALEQSRTAEHAAVSRREERQRRRDAGLPELTRRERLREWTSDVGERLSQPRYLALTFVVVVVIVGGVGYLVLSGGSEADGKRGKHGGHTTAKLAPSEIEVAVLNGTAVPDLAATIGDKVERKGFELGIVSNTNQSFADSVVMFERGHGTEAHKVAKQLGITKVQPMNQEVESASSGAGVAVVVGEDNAAAAG